MLNGPRLFVLLTNRSLPTQEIMTAGVGDAYPILPNDTSFD
jgi:outer membrane protein OmpA-like peptidoglycan-associated protein